MAQQAGEAAKHNKVWNLRFQQLQAYKETHGDCNVPENFIICPHLGKWVNGQRRLKRKGVLSAEREAQLDSVGFVWEKMDVWDLRFQQLEAFKQIHGDCNVPENYILNPQLKKWVDRQRHQKRKGQLRAEHEAKLDSVGFVWDQKEMNSGGAWNTRFQQLMEYKKTTTNGDSKVPRKYNPQLGRWVKRQRLQKRNGQLPDNCEAKLDSIGFDWNQSSWNVRFQQLEEYKHTHNGDCNVPKNYSLNPQLGKWVQKQSHQKRRGQLPDDCEAKLESIGFVWNQSAWNLRFQQLEEYKHTHGDCNVPQKFALNPQLGKWVKKQRSQQKRGRMTDACNAKLDSIGFVWSQEDFETCWNLQFQQLEIS